MNMRAAIVVASRGEGNGAQCDLARADRLARMDTRDLVRMALEEDVGPGDRTTEATVPADVLATGKVFAKQTLVLAGHEEAAEVFSQLGATYVADVSEGTEVSPGAIVARVEGRARSLLTGERVALNFLMRLSGIATHTRSVVRRAGTLSVVDTRKTTPLHRASERRAVRAGGAANHRFALYDGILVKNNHIAIAGGIAPAMERARTAANHLAKIEIEVRTLGELEEALAAGAEAILLDNMSDEDLRAAVRRVGGTAVLEASGNMDADRIAGLADSGLDLVSMGGLVHQARWVDLSMRIEPS
jgi:nicotinate-nucleotide pyrophosphorylase (carboxylating)